VHETNGLQVLQQFGNAGDMWIDEYLMNIMQLAHTCEYAAAMPLSRKAKTSSGGLIS
jgi:hypothetical protein